MVACCASDAESARRVSPAISVRVLAICAEDAPNCLVDGVCKIVLLTPSYAITFDTYDSALRLYFFDVTEPPSRIHHTLATGVTIASQIRAAYSQPVTAKSRFRLKPGAKSRPS